MEAGQVYLDNHATTRTDPRVVAAMLPFFTEHYGNAGSTSHTFGWDARDAVKASREQVAQLLGASDREVIFTSGATESNNLAIKGVAERLKQRGNHIISVCTEHKSVLDPLARLSRRGFEVSLLPVRPNGDRAAGQIDLAELASTIRPTTIICSVMLANNEIGVIQPIAKIAEICRSRNVVLHCDAVQAVGKIAVRVEELGVDFLSFSGHKFYGPKGIGGLYIRRKNLSTRLEPMFEGGGQEGGLRSGTLNVPGIVGLAKALELCHDELADEQQRLSGLRNRLFSGLQSRIEHLELNGPSLNGPSLDGPSLDGPSLDGPSLDGPSLDDRTLRLPGNLNCSIAYVNGEALMMSMRDVAVSSGSACTSINPEPSHVLQALGLSADQARASLRFGLGRFTTESEIDFAVDAIAKTVLRLRSLANR